ncbi:hypothetical protein LPJ38_11255 [Bradyrhizobium daqingense]|nr:hypothetical protein [Bradyrhizobium daqingense]UFS91271.1 hypothetical protein LPJ38_11255 [Bradyrhizobium daqingense]
MARPIVVALMSQRAYQICASRRRCRCCIEAIAWAVKSVVQIAARKARVLYESAPACTSSACVAEVRRPSSTVGCISQRVHLRGVSGDEEGRQQQHQRATPDELSAKISLPL